MSFLRHLEIFPSDEGETLSGSALAHRLDEFPAGYSLASCSPAEPASASPADHHFEVPVVRRTMILQPTASCRLTACLSQGVHRNLNHVWVGIEMDPEPPGFEKLASVIVRLIQDSQTN